MGALTPAEGPPSVSIKPNWHVIPHDPVLVPSLDRNKHVYIKGLHVKHVDVYFRYDRELDMHTLVCTCTFGNSGTCEHIQEVIKYVRIDQIKEQKIKVVQLPFLIEGAEGLGAVIPVECAVSENPLMFSNAWSLRNYKVDSKLTDTFHDESPLAVLVDFISETAPVWQSYPKPHGNPRYCGECNYKDDNSDSFHILEEFNQLIYACARHSGRCRMCYVTSVLQSHEPGLLDFFGWVPNSETLKKHLKSRQKKIKVSHGDITFPASKLTVNINDATESIKGFSEAIVRASAELPTADELSRRLRP